MHRYQRLFLLLFYGPRITADWMIGSASDSDATQEATPSSAWKTQSGGRAVFAGSAQANPSRADRVCTAALFSWGDVSTYHDKHNLH